MIKALACGSRGAARPAAPALLPSSRSGARPARAARRRGKKTPPAGASGSGMAGTVRACRSRVVRVGDAIPPAAVPGEAVAAVASRVQVVRPAGRSTWPREATPAPTPCGTTANGMAQGPMRRRAEELKRIAEVGKVFPWPSAPLLCNPFLEFQGAFCAVEQIRIGDYFNPTKVRIVGTDRAFDALPIYGRVHVFRVTNQNCGLRPSH